MMQENTVFGSVWQCVAVSCSVLQYFDMMQYSLTLRLMFRSDSWYGVAVCCRKLQCLAVCCSVLQWVAACCSKFA